MFNLRSTKIDEASGGIATAHTNILYMYKVFPGLKELDKKAMLYLVKQLKTPVKEGTNIFSKNTKV